MIIRVLRIKYQMEVWEQDGNYWSEVESGNIILLFLDRVHTMIGAGRRRRCKLMRIKYSKPLKEIYVIGAATIVNIGNIYWKDAAGRGDAFSVWWRTDKWSVWTYFRGESRENRNPSSRKENDNCSEGRHVKKRRWLSKPLYNDDVNIFGWAVLIYAENVFEIEESYGI